MLQCAKADDPKEFENLFKAKCLRTILWEQGSSSDQLRLLKIEDLDKSFTQVQQFPELMKTEDEWSPHHAYFISRLSNRLSVLTLEVLSDADWLGYIQTWMIDNARSQLPIQHTYN
ncbi:hypothetical protein G4B88_015007 [Cannabis sativa]|uniref:Uncharacterized protein n=1 Tax=Cannabis sativa TaxID=3483 RepID=A0A7J6DMR5_CANSA|nr:hypothetical protein G4B88_015007 [Cannabis sativa]